MAFCSQGPKYLTLQFLYLTIIILYSKIWRHYYYSDALLPNSHAGSKVGRPTRISGTILPSSTSQLAVSRILSQPEPPVSL